MNVDPPRDSDSDSGSDHGSVSSASHAEVIQRAAGPAVRAPVRMVVLALLLGLVSMGAAFVVLPPDLPLRRTLAVVIMAAFFWCLVMLIMRLLYPPVSFDAATASVRFGGRRLQASAIVRATRSVSSGGSTGSGAVSVTYRLYPATGRPVRILVVGRPLVGLDVTGARALRSLLEASSIPARREGSTPAADILASTLQADLGAGEVGREGLIAELTGLIDGAEVAPRSAVAADATTTADDGAEAGGTATATSAKDALRPPALRTEEFAEDDRLAQLRLAAVPTGPLLLSRVAVTLVVLAVIGFLVTVGIMVVLEMSGARDDALGSVLIGLCVAVGLPALLVWAAAKDIHDRRIQAVVDEWVSEADAGRRSRGLPVPFQRVAMRIGVRMLTIGFFSALVVGILAAMIGGGLLLGDEPKGIPTIALVVGIALIALGTILWRRQRARKRQAAQRLASLIGPRER